MQSSDHNHQPGEPKKRGAARASAGHAAAAAAEEQQGASSFKQQDPGKMSFQSAIVAASSAMGGDAEPGPGQGEKL